MHVGGASTSDCRFETRSNMGTVVLCPNVSRRGISPGEAFASRSRQDANERAKRPRRDPTSARAEPADELVKTGEWSRQDAFKFRCGRSWTHAGLAVSNHGRTGRHHVLRIRRGIFSNSFRQRYRSGFLSRPAPDVSGGAEYALTSRTLHLRHRSVLTTALPPNG